MFNSFSLVNVIRKGELKPGQINRKSNKASKLLAFVCVKGTFIIKPAIIDL